MVDVASHTHISKRIKVISDSFHPSYSPCHLLTPVVPLERTVRVMGLSDCDVVDRLPSRVVCCLDADAELPAAGRGSGEGAEEDGREDLRARR